MNDLEPQKVLCPFDQATATIRCSLRSGTAQFEPARSQSWSYRPENELPGQRQRRKTTNRRMKRHADLLTILGAVVYEKLTGTHVDLDLVRDDRPSKPRLSKGDIVALLENFED